MACNRRKMYNPIQDGEMQMKTTPDTISHLSDWQKSKHLTINSVDEAMEKKEKSYITGKNAKWHKPYGGELEERVQ